MDADTDNQQDDPLAELDDAIPESSAEPDEINADNVDAMIEQGLSQTRSSIEKRESTETYGLTFDDLLMLKMDK